MTDDARTRLTEMAAVARTVFAVPAPVPTEPAAPAAAASAAVPVAPVGAAIPLATPVPTPSAMEPPPLALLQEIAFLDD